MAPNLLCSSGHVDAFDRIRFRLDGPLPASATNALSLLCCDLKLTATSLKFHRQWTHDLDVLQPQSPLFPLALADALGSGLTCEPYYVEIARDFRTGFQIEAARMARHFLAHAVLKYSRALVHPFGHGYYFGQRDSHRRLAVYGDARTKLFTPSYGQPALHLELRLSGAHALQQHGLRGIFDFADFDFGRAWQANLGFWSLPPRVVLGRALGCNSLRSDSLQRAARDALADQEHLTNGVFTMHNLVVKNRAIQRALLPMTINKWARAARTFALMPP